MRSYKFNFDYGLACNELNKIKHIIEESLCTGSPDIIVNTLEDNLVPILKKTKIKNIINKNVVNLNEDMVTKECDELYSSFISKVRDPMITEAYLDNIYQNYQNARNKLNDIIIQQSNHTVT